MQGTETHARVVSSTGAHAAGVRSASLTERRQVVFYCGRCGAACAAHAHKLVPPRA